MDRSSSSYEQVCSSMFSTQCTFDSQYDVRVRASGAGWPISGFEVTGTVYPLTEAGYVGSVACAHNVSCGSVYVGGHVLNEAHRTIRAPS